MNARQHAGAVELDVVVVRRAARRKILGQLPPLAPGGQHIEYRINQRAPTDLALRRQEWLYQLELVVGKIARIPQPSALVALPVLLRPHAHLRESRARRYRITTDSYDSRNFRTGSKLMAKCFARSTTICAISRARGRSACHLTARFGRAFCVGGKHPVGRSTRLHVQSPGSRPEKRLREIGLTGSPRLPPQSHADTAKSAGSPTIFSYRHCRMPPFNTGAVRP